MMFSCFKLKKSKSLFISAVTAALISLSISAPCLFAQTWTPVTPTPTTGMLKGVTYAKSMYISVGLNGVILTSSNGATWTSRTSGTTKALYSVSGNNNVLVAVGEAGTIVTSSNGTTWSLRTSNTTSDLFGVTTNGTLFVAAGATSTILTSTDGTTWSKKTFATASDLSAIAWGNNQFVAVGFDGIAGTINSSTNGSDWINHPVNEAEHIKSIAWCGSKFIIGTDYLSGDKGIVVSANGIDWVEHTLENVNMIFGSIANSNRIICVGIGGSILSLSSDSVSIAQTSGISADLYGVTWGNNLFVAVGDAGAILTSTQSSAVIDGKIISNNQTFPMSVKNRTVHFNLTSDAAITLNLYSMQGKVLRSMSKRLPKGEHSLPFLSSLANGKYLVSLKTGDKTVEQPVIIAK